jgi:hypothetical protein
VRDYDSLFFIQYSRKALRRGSDSRSRWRFAAALLAMMSSRWQTGKPSTSMCRRHASSKRSIPSGAKIRSRSNGPFFNWMKSFPRSISAACSPVNSNPSSWRAVYQSPAILRRALRENICNLRGVRKPQQDSAGLFDEEVSHTVAQKSVSNFLSLSVFKRGHSLTKREDSLRTNGGSLPYCRRSGSWRHPLRVYRCE